MLYFSEFISMFKHQNLTIEGVMKNNYQIPRSYLQQKLLYLMSFIVFVLKAFRQAKCFDTASSLSYTTLLSVVPFFALIFAGFSSFPVFQDVMSELENFIFSNFIPASSDVIRNHLMAFVGKTSKLTMVGILSLIVIALLLMWKIDQALNQIWASTVKRNYLNTLMTYWAILTLGPILIGLSLMATSYLTSLPIISDAAESIGVKKYVLRSVATVFTLSAFTLIYLVVPTKRIRLKHALLGGLVATVFFEIAKQGFAWYVSNNQTYQNIYGALSTIPIFLLWIYISWLIILFGAMVARSLDIFDFQQQLKHKHLGKVASSNQLFISAYYLLYKLWQAAKIGDVLKENEIECLPYMSKGSQLQQVFLALENQKWIHRTEQQKWALSRDLDSVCLDDVYQSLYFCLPRQTDLSSLSVLVKQIQEKNQQDMSVSLKLLFVEQEKEESKSKAEFVEESECLALDVSDNS